MSTRAQHRPPSTLPAPRRRALRILSLVVAALAFLGLAAHGTIRDALEHETRARLLATLEAGASALEDRASVHAAIARTWAASPEVGALIESQLRLSQQGAAATSVQLADPNHGLLAERLRAVCAEHGYRGYLVLDRDRRVVSPGSGEAPGTVLPASLARDVEAAFSGRSSVARPFAAAVPFADGSGTGRAGLPTMLALAPVRDGQGTVVAAFAFRLDPDEHFSSALRGSRPGESGDTYALDDQGTLLTASRFEGQLRELGLLDADPEVGSALSLRVCDPGVDLTRAGGPRERAHPLPLTRAAAALAQGASGSDVRGYRDYRGVKVVGAWTWLDALGMGLVSELDRSAAYWALIPIQQSFLAIIALLGICMLGLVWSLQGTRRWRDRSARSEQDARRIVDTAMDAFVGIDERGAVVDWNLEAERLFGWTRSEALGRPLQELIMAPAQAQQHARGLAAYVSSGVSKLVGRRHEFPALRRDGSAITVELALNPLLRTREGLRISAFLRDVTERRRGEEYAKLQSQALEMLAGQTSLIEVLGVVVSALEVRCPGLLGSVLLLDETGKHLLHGAAPSLPEAYNRAVNGLAIGPEVGSCGSAAFHSRRVIVEDTAVDPLWAEYRELARRHGLRACWSQPVLSTERRVLGTFALYYREPRTPSEGELAALDEATHIASVAIERRRFEAEQERLRHAVDAAADGIVLTDLDGRMLRANPAFSLISGYSPGELLGNTPRLLRSGEHSSEFYREMWATISSGSVWSGRVVNRHKDGSPFHVALTIAPITSGNGRITGYVGIHRDIRADIRRESELQQVVADLARARQVAEVASRSKSEFLANMSHEIRTPLTAILGFAELLHEERAERDGSVENGETVRTILKNGQHLLGLINDILDLSKIEADRLTIEKLECSPRLVLAEVESALRFRADEKGLELRFEQEGPLPETILSDPGRLRQILMNLVGNALKFTVQGSVRVVTRLRLAGAPLLEFDVIDTGIGLSPAQRLDLFQPFVQAESSTARRFGGTGLGLVISKRLAELLGGEVRIVDSEPGAGTVLRATIAPGPLHGVALLEADGEPPPAFPSSAGDERFVLPPGCRVLLAEDSRDNQRLISLHLRRAGAEVEFAQNGREAVECVRRSRNPGARGFDLILMDMHMPEVDGYDATRQLREQGHRGPIIALTANAMQGDREKCLEAGCTDYATKPIERRTFFAALQRGLAAHAGHAGAPAFPAAPDPGAQGA